MKGPGREPQEMLERALHHLQLALDLLDRASAPAQIGAHIDLALNQLASYLAEAFHSPGPFQ